MSVRTAALTAALVFAASLAMASWTPASAFINWTLKNGHCVNVKTGATVAMLHCQGSVTAHPPKGAGGGTTKNDILPTDQAPAQK